jgi:hypothetical protein
MEKTYEQDIAGETSGKFGKNNDKYGKTTT